jgi:hypothetical protein
MSVVNGQKVEASVVNNAFMSRVDNTSTIGKVALQNTDAGSGSAIINTQGYINKLANIVGTSELDPNALNYASNDVVADGDNHKVAIEKLDDYAGDLRADVTVIQAEQIVQNNRLTTIESQNSTFAGDKTFTGNVTVQGNLDVNGTLTTIDSTQLEVKDAFITINSGGTDATAEGSGIEVERPSGNAGIEFDSSLASKFKIGLVSNLREIIVSGVAQVIGGLKDFTSGIKTDTINESTSNTGVTIESVLIKNGLVDGRDVSADGTTLDGHTTTLATHTTQIGQLQTDVSNIQAEQVTQNNRLTNIESNNSTFGGNKTFSNNVVIQGSLEVTGTSIKTNTINESTLNAGVTIESVLIKNGLVDGRDISADYSDHESRISALESSSSSPSTFTGNKTFTNDVTVQGTLTANKLVVNSALVLGATVNTQTGSNVTLNVTSPYVSLEQGMFSFGSLDSVTEITAPSDTRMLTIVNNTMFPVTFKHNATFNDGRILTPTQKDVKLKPNQVAIFVYNNNSMNKGWLLSSGSSPVTKTFEFKIRGTYGGMSPTNVVDGFWINSNPITIFNVFLYQKTPGSSGTTTIDIKYVPFGSSTTYSIFDTLPSVTPSAGSNKWCGMGDTVTGFTMPATFTSGNPEITGVGAKTGFRMDLISAQSGPAADLGVIIHYYDTQ